MKSLARFLAPSDPPNPGQFAIMICRREGIAERGGGDGMWEDLLGEFPKLFCLGWVGGLKNSTCPSSFPSLFGLRGVGG